MKFIALILEVMSDSMEDRFKRDLVVRYELSWQFKDSVKINELVSQTVVGGECLINIKYY